MIRIPDFPLITYQSVVYETYTTFLIKHTAAEMRQYFQI